MFHVSMSISLIHWIFWITKTTFRGCTGQLRNMVNVFPLPVWPQRG